MVYAAVKELHIAAVALSGALFVLRGVWMIADSPFLYIVAVAVRKNPLPLP